VDCGAEFEANAPQAKYCNACREARYKQQRRAWYEEQKAKRHAAAPKCIQCGAPIWGGNGNSKYCPKCSKARRQEQNKESAERVAKRPKKVTCHGCVDAVSRTGGSAFGCDYFLHYGHCRPWPIVNGVCAGRSTKKREFVEWPWDTEKARKLFEKGKAEEEVAAELGITKNALNNWIFRGMPNGDAP
jgi:hypothetical protein